ncbi:hypothetical protein [Streptomyces sp. NBC_00233]|uniref:hypothetical protein n=1 Tax=Streptomyces sp. NBC_00233 TaxID=2975686 RepID=UPI0022551E2B|nr:hypothetical protein [Streptomyces sp. NBC_00233]MCX5231605.1 hypothetical protein [Streptomyces sp. NBC_00233]
MSQRHLPPPRTVPTAGTGQPAGVGRAAGAGQAARTGGRPVLGLAARTTVGVADRAITAAAARAGAPGGLRFTERQLYYETCRVLSPGSTLLRGRVPGTPAPVLRLPVFTRALEARGRETVPGLLPPLPEPVARVEPAPSREPSERSESSESSRSSEPDLYDYGLPRLLMCQDRSIAGMLLANHVHLEAACPVFAATDALPLDPRLLAALQRAEGATVYVLHDASPAGLAFPALVRAGLGPVPGVRVVSLGLVPRHAAALRLPTGRGRAPGPADRAALPAALRPREADWLAEGRFAEVAAVPPDRLLRTVLRLTRGPRPPRDSLWSGLRGLRGTGFMTWPAA